MTTSGPTPGRRAAHKVATREAIQAAATRLFEARGYAGTTVAMIASEAGITERTLFRYFASKDELVAHRVLERMPALRDLVAGRPAEESDLVAIRNALVLALRQAGADPGQPSVLSLFEGGPPGPRMLRTGASLLLQVEATLAEALARRQALSGASGPAGPDLRCEVLAAAAVAACRRALIHHARLRRAGAADPPDLATVLGQAFGALGA